MNRYFITVIFCVLPFLLVAQEPPDDSQLGDTLVTNADLFESAEPLELTLTFDMKKYQREKHKEEYMPVHLKLHVNDTIDIEKDVRIKSRGNFRKDHCSFAPFWLNIRKADVKNIYLQDVKKMKIVTHCRKLKDYGSYVLKEYLAYKLYSIITPISFRVRLIRMVYVDTGRKNRVTKGWAFMIEPEEMLAERHDALVIKNDKLSMKVMNQEELMLASLFQYMIGNSDYSVAGRHNMKILGLRDSDRKDIHRCPMILTIQALWMPNMPSPGRTWGSHLSGSVIFLAPAERSSHTRKPSGTWKITGPGSLRW